jgi:hypothetical protein
LLLHQLELGLCCSSEAASRLSLSAAQMRELIGVAGALGHLCIATF